MLYSTLLKPIAAMLLIGTAIAKDPVPGDPKSYQCKPCGARAYELRCINDKVLVRCSKKSCWELIHVSMTEGETCKEIIMGPKKGEGHRTVVGVQPWGENDSPKRP